MLEEPFATDEEREADARAERAYWRRIAILICVVVAVGVAAAGALRKAFGAEPTMRFDCGAIAELVTGYADFRDTGARLELVVRLARERLDTPAEKAVIEREIKRIWSEGLEAEDAGHAVYKRCRAQLGDMGSET